MTNLDLENHKWSPWHRFDADVKSISVPDKPGVYEVRTNFEFGRLKGTSALVYIGSTVSSLRKRVCEQHFSDIVRYMSRAEKWMLQANHVLEFRWAATASAEEARYLEALRIMEYENQHWELPPGNDKLELNAIRKRVEQRHGKRTEKMLNELLK